MNSLAAPTFDFSALGDLSGQAAEADQQFDLHYGTAQDEYLISCIYLARVHALTAKAGRYGGGTWTKWYESKGLSHGSATKMVQNGDAFKSSTVDELKCLPELTRKDLNLIARSGCAEQLTATAGDSQRVQELLAQIKSKDAQLEAAHADISGLKDRATAAEAREEEALSMVSKAQDEAKAAQENLDYEVSQNDALHEERGSCCGSVRRQSRPVQRPKPVPRMLRISWPGPGRWPRRQSCGATSSRPRMMHSRSSPSLRWWTRKRWSVRPGKWPPR